MTPYHHSHHKPSDDMPAFLRRLRQLKPFLAPLGVIIVIIGIILTVQQVQRLQEVRKGAFAGGAKLLMTSDADNNEIKEGNDFTVNVLLDTQDNDVTAADITILYPKDNIELTSVDLGSFLPGHLSAPVIQNGQVNFALARNPEVSVTGAGVLATLRFTALTKSADPLQITFGPTTDVTATENPETNIIDTATPLSVRVKASSVVNGSSLLFESSKTTVAPNEEFTVTTILDPKGRQITGAEIRMKYPADKIDVIDVVEKDLLPLPLQKDLTSTPGTAVFAVASSTSQSATTSGEIAVFTLRAKATASGSVPITFSTATKVSELGELDLNVVGEMTGISVTVAGGPLSPVPSTTTPTITPTRAPSPTVSVSPTPIVYKATLNGDQEVPPVTTQASGTAYLYLYPDRKAKITVRFSNLGSPQELAHIHGPAPIGSNTSPLFNLPVGAFTDYPITLTAAQVLQLTNELWYVNLHTQNFGNGEIRGQFALSNEDPNLTPSPPVGEPTNTPFPTATPQATSMVVSIKIPTIGSIGAETNPVNTSRSVNIEMYQGTVLARTVSGTLAYDGTVFKGNVNVGAGFESGSYILKTKLSNTLRKNLGTYTVNTNIILPVATMIMGDTIDDNKLNIFDYNVLISCYEARAGTDDCKNEKDLADLNDSGSVDSTDYNILIRSFEDQIIGD